MKTATRNSLIRLTFDVLGSTIVIAATYGLVWLARHLFAFDSVLGSVGGVVFTGLAFMVGGSVVAVFIIPQLKSHSKTWRYLQRPLWRDRA